MNITYIFLLTAIISGCNNNSIPSGGHNGITFDMNQKDVEKLGFICIESAPEAWFSASCSHMDMTGRAFSHNTDQYSLIIDRQDGKVCQINAIFSDISNMKDYILVSSKVTDFYPVEVHFKKIGSAHMGMWIDKNKSRLTLDYSSGMPPVLPDKINVSFWSPSRPWKD